MEAKNNFWQHKTLEEFSHEEWEALCDGCGRCCLVKIEYEDENGALLDELAFTDVACRLLDLDTCQCKDYKNRKKIVPECIELTPDQIRTLPWIPSSCAYRLLHEGKDLQTWHPLISGCKTSIHNAGISVLGRAVPEDHVCDEDLVDHIVEWPA